MNLFWAPLIAVGSVSLGLGLCYYLVSQARASAVVYWIHRHMLCPVIRILVLLIVVSQVYPSINADGDSLDFWRTLLRHGHFHDLVNILFLGGLAMSFLPLLNHPVLALPLQSMFSIALVFYWQYVEIVADPVLFPTIGVLVKILVYMLAAYFVTRELSVVLSRRIDARYNISGSISLVSDALYLVLQIPVMLIYTGFLKAQLP